MAKTTKQPAQPNARETYQAHANDIARLIDVLQMELQKHAEATKSTENCWGKVGDLGKVRWDLIEVVSFISGMEHKAVEAFLAE